MSKCLDEQGLRRVWGRVKSYLATMLVDFTEEQLEEICDFEEGMNEDEVIPKATKDLLGCVVVGDGLDVDIHGVLKNAQGIDLLWENAEPTSSFPEQTIIVPGISEYPMILVYAYESITSTTETMTFARFGKTTRVRQFYNYRQFRNFDYKADDKLWFSQGYEAAPTATSATASNKSAIPVAVYGIKGVS